MAGSSTRQLLIFCIQAILLALVNVMGCTEERREIPLDALKLDIQPLKSQFVEGESIVINTVFRNQAPFGFRINNEWWAWPNTCSLSFEIEDPLGKKVEKERMYIRRPNPNKQDFTAINGNGQWEYKADLRYFNKPLTVPGVYKITATYMNKDDGSEYGVNAWVGTVTSNMASFGIVKKQ